MSKKEVDTIKNKALVKSATTVFDMMIMAIVLVLLHQSEMDNIAVFVIGVIIFLLSFIKNFTHE